MSTVTEERESVLAIAQRTLSNLEGLEEEHAEWLEALAAWQSLGDGAELAQPEEEDGWEEERQTVWRYLERQAEEGHDSSAVSEDGDPVLGWLEDALDIVTVVHHRGGDSEPVGWELLLGYGGPTIRLELSVDGRATVSAAWWSAPEYAHGRLDWLANYLEELGL